MGDGTEDPQLTGVDSNAPAVDETAAGAVEAQPVQDATERYSAFSEALKSAGVPMTSRTIGVSNYYFVQGVTPPSVDFNMGQGFHVPHSESVRVGRETANGLLKYISSPSITDEKAKEIWGILSDSVKSDPSFAQKPNAQKLFASLDALVTSGISKDEKVNILKNAVNIYYKDASIMSEDPQDISATTLNSVEGTLPESVQGAPNSQPDGQDAGTPPPPANPLEMPPAVDPDHPDKGPMGLDQIMFDAATNSGFFGTSRGTRIKNAIGSATFTSDGQKALAEVIGGYVAAADDTNPFDGGELSSDVKSRVTRLVKGTATAEDYDTMFKQGRGYAGKSTESAKEYYFENITNEQLVDFVKVHRKNFNSFNEIDTIDDDLQLIKDSTKRSIATYANEFFKENPGKEISYSDTKVFSKAFGDDNEATYAFLNSSVVKPEDGSKLVASLDKGRVKELLENPPANEAGEPDLAARNKMLALALATYDSKDPGKSPNSFKDAKEFFESNFIEDGKLKVAEIVDLVNSEGFQKNKGANEALAAYFGDKKNHEMLVEAFNDPTITAGQQLALAAGLSKNFELIFEADGTDPVKLGTVLKGAYESQDPNFDGFLKALATKDGINLNDVLSNTFGTAKDEANQDVPFVPLDVAKKLDSINPELTKGIKVQNRKGEPVSFKDALDDFEVGKATDAVMAAIDQGGHHEEPKNENCITALISMFTNLFNPQAKEAEKDSDLDLQRNLGILNVEGGTLQEKIDNFLKTHPDVAKEITANPDKDAFEIIMAATNTEVGKMKKAAVAEESFKDNPQVTEVDGFAIARDGSKDTIYFSAYDKDGKNILFDDLKNTKGEVVQGKNDNAEAIQGKIKNLITADLDLRTLADGLGEKDTVTAEQAKEFASKVGTGIVHIGHTEYTIMNGEIVAINGKAPTAVDGKTAEDYIAEQMTKDLKNKSNYTELPGTPPAFLLKMDFSITEGTGDSSYSFRFNVPLDVTTSAYLKYIDLNGLEAQTLQGVFKAAGARALLHDYEAEEIKLPPPVTNPEPEDKKQTGPSK